MSLTWFIPSFVLLHLYKRINTTSEKIIEIKDQLIAVNERQITELKSNLLATKKKVSDLLNDTQCPQYTSDDGFENSKDNRQPLP